MLIITGIFSSQNTLKDLVFTLYEPIKTDMALFIPFIACAFFFISCSPIQFAPEARYTSSSGNIYRQDTDGTNRSSGRQEEDDRYSSYDDGWDCGEFYLDNNVYIDHYINYYSEGAGRYTMTVALERSSRYVPLMQRLFEESGLPEKLAYISMVESEFDPTAVNSDSGATGHWQFTRSTAGDYNLHIDKHVDERRDPVLSTKAAIQYLKRLCNIFYDWNLAIAGYNGGGSRISNTVLISSTSDRSGRDFWYLYEKKILRKETREFVPKVIARIKIAQDPNKYDFYNLNYQPPLSYELVRIRNSSSLSYIADKLGVPLSQLKELNPMYLGDHVPVYGKETYIRVPD
ncbi:MAG: lytic transglycosylase domain-containing protein [Bdellovibrionales bacterium]|nr:lytic transglycosylase domain-containing protein [Bdellovibrionales bacterium]